MREVSRSETWMAGQDFLVPFGGAGHPGGCLKELAQQGENQALKHLANRRSQQSRKEPQCPGCQGCPSDTGAYNRVRIASRDSSTSTRMVAT